MASDFACGFSIGNENMKNTNKINKIDDYVKPCVTLVLCLVYLAVVFRNAWAGDDSYIIFRTIEQIFAGNGPRWNPVDRVQSFTSPLWLMLLCIPRIFSTDVYINAIGVSILVNAVMIAIAMKSIHSLIPRVFFIILILSSNAFMDYSTSGLEYPLIYMLVVLLLILYLRIYSGEYHLLNKLALTAGLMLLTRHDLLLLAILPVLHAYWICAGKTKSLKEKIIPVVLFILPILLWTIYSIIYYGFPFPNTAYVKLGMNVPRWQLVEQGFAYILDGVIFDFFSIAIMAIFAVLMLVSSNKSHRVIALSALLTLLYVVWVGADFMSGRFYSYVVIFVVLAYVIEFQKRIEREKLSFLVVFVLPVIIYHLCYGKTPLNTPKVYEKIVNFHGVSDERGNYSSMTSIWKWLDNKESYFPDTGPSLEALELRKDNIPFHYFTAIGIAGYWLGVDEVIIDYIALPDAMRARLPRIASDWYVGHTTRALPGNYGDSLISGHPQLPDDRLNEYFRVISLITQSKDLLAPERLVAIVKMNLGMYDYLIQQSQLVLHDKSNAWNSACFHAWSIPRPLFTK